MTIAPAIIIGLSVLGALLLIVGITGLIRDGRRIATPVYLAMGSGLLALGIGLWFSNLGNPAPLTIVVLIAGVVLLLGNIVGYPALVIFLLYSGLTILRKESRSLGNALALLAGIGLFFLPATMRMLAPSDTVSTDTAYMLRYGAHLTVMLIVFYFGFTFTAFIAAWLLYQRRRIRTEPEAIIVLGSGLIKGKVPPLLAARLKRGFAVQSQFGSRPTIITSGRQGADEPRPEGEAMRDYLIEHGAEPSRVVAETESRTTEENLRFSRKLLSEPNAHVVGAPTAWYYFPSAFIREFVGVIRDRLRFTVLSIFVLIIVAISFTIVIVPAMVPVPAV